MSHQNSSGFCNIATKCHVLYLLATPKAFWQRSERSGTYRAYVASKFQRIL
jgi:hypothetical protein